MSFGSFQVKRTEQYYRPHILQVPQVISVDHTTKHANICKNL